MYEVIIRDYFDFDRDYAIDQVFTGTGDEMEDLFSERVDALDGYTLNETFSGDSCRNVIYTRWDEEEMDLHTVTICLVYPA